MSVQRITLERALTPSRPELERSRYKYALRNRITVSDRVRTMGYRMDVHVQSLEVITDRLIRNGASITAMINFHIERPSKDESVPTFG